VTFDIATADGTATTADGDYVGKSLTAQTIPAGSSTYTFSVTVNGDTKNETDETFSVNVTNVTGASVTDGQGQGTITDNDAAATIAIVSGNNQSAVKNANFTNPLVVEVRNAAGALVQGVSVVFTAPAAGASSVFSTTTNTITVSTNASGQASTGTFAANGTAGGPYNVTATASGGASTSFSLTNLPPVFLSIDDVTKTEGDSGSSQTYTFTVSLDNPAGPGGVTFDIATADGTATTADGDYVGKSLTAQTIPAGS